MELLVLGLVAGIGFASYALWHKARKDEGEALAAERKRLMAPAERSPTTIQVGDVVQHLGSDFLVEGVVTFSEDGRGARLYRLFEDGGERFLYAKAGGADPLLLAPTAPTRRRVRRRRRRRSAREPAARRRRLPPDRARAGVGHPRRPARRPQARRPRARLRVRRARPGAPARSSTGATSVEAFAGERVLASALEILPAR